MHPPSHQGGQLFRALLKIFVSVVRRSILGTVEVPIHIIKELRETAWGLEA